MQEGKDVETKMKTWGTGAPSPLSLAAHGDCVLWLESSGGATTRIYDPIHRIGLQKKSLVVCQEDLTKRGVNDKSHGRLRQFFLAQSTKGQKLDSYLTGESQSLGYTAYDTKEHVFLFGGDISIWQRLLGFRIVCDFKSKFYSCLLAQ